MTITAACDAGFVPVVRVQWGDQEAGWDVCKARAQALLILQAAEMAETMASVRRFCVTKSKDAEAGRASAERLLEALGEDRDQMLKTWLRALLGGVNDKQ